MKPHDLALLIDAADPGKTLRPWPILGDLMAPTLKRGDMILCRPVDHYEGTGVYVLADGGVFRVEGAGRDMLCLRPDNPRYSPQDVSRKWFDFNVLGRSEYAINSMEGQPLPGVLEAVQHQGRAWV